MDAHNNDGYEGEDWGGFVKPLPLENAHWPTHILQAGFVGGLLWVLCHIDDAAIIFPTIKRLLPYH